MKKNKQQEHYSDCLEFKIDQNTIITLDYGDYLKVKNHTWRVTPYDGILTTFKEGYYNKYVCIEKHILDIYEEGEVVTYKDGNPNNLRRNNLIYGKVCKKCGNRKCKSEFHKASDKSDGLRSYCKECRKL